MNKKLMNSKDKYCDQCLKSEICEFYAISRALHLRMSLCSEFTEILGLKK